jgi:hypothetical protein
MRLACANRRFPDDRQRHEGAEPHALCCRASEKEKTERACYPSKDGN